MFILLPFNLNKQLCTPRTYGVDIALITPILVPNEERISSGFQANRMV